MLEEFYITDTSEWYSVWEGSKYEDKDEVRLLSPLCIIFPVFLFRLQE